MHVTRHARKRMHERDGTKKGSAERKASLALERGYRLEDTKGRLHLWMLEQRKKGDADNLRVYGDKLFIFHGDTLITVTVLPPDIRRDILAYIKGKRNAQKNKGLRHYTGGEEEGL